MSSPLGWWGTSVAHPSGVRHASARSEPWGLRVRLYPPAQRLIPLGPASRRSLARPTRRRSPERLRTLPSTTRWALPLRREEEAAGVSAVTSRMGGLSVSGRIPEAPGSSYAGRLRPWPWPFAAAAAVLAGAAP
jgi:hypothetical protein